MYRLFPREECDARLQTVLLGEDVAWFRVQGVGVKVYSVGFWVWVWGRLSVWELGFGVSLCVCGVGFGKWSFGAGACKYPKIRSDEFTV